MCIFLSNSRVNVPPIHQKEAKSCLQSADLLLNKGILFMETRKGYCVQKINEPIFIRLNMQN